MLVQIIKRYLEFHKRLVVPQLGAFIVKEPGGSVLFSELFRRDDGVLRGLLQAEGMNELEAAGAIDRFVFEVRHAVQGGGEYRLEEFGVFRSGPNETLIFVHTPVPVVSAEAAPAADTVPETGPHDRTSAAGSADAWSAAGSALQPDPSLKGLRYGKPLKTTDAYTFADRRSRRRTDRFLLVAILAAAIALAAIAFGYVHEACENRTAGEQVAEPRTPSVQVQPAAPVAAEPSTQIPENK